MTAYGSPTILMLEPDADDRLLTESVLQEIPDPPGFEFVSYSNELFDRLENCDRLGMPYPALIMITLQSVPLNAQGILKKIKSIDRYKHIPVVILTGTRQESVIKECYALGASSFIQKPVTAGGTIEKITNFLQYWFKTVELT